MAANVWTLSVNLETKTATFQSGMSEAARSARGAFSEIKDGAQTMGRETGGSMMEARHGVMLLGEEFGIRLPRALTTFIASLGPIGAAMETAFPFLAIAVGATLLLQHLSKVREEGQKLTESQTNFGTAISNVFNQLDSKLLEAGIRSDELNGNHLGALEKQLAVIDHQSMEDLVRSFDAVSKAAESTLGQLKTSWYQFGAGSAGAQHALTDFKTQYESLLAQGKDKDASDLLSGTLKSAERVLELQKQAMDNQTRTGAGGSHQGDYTKYEAAKNALKQQGIGFTEKEVEAQQDLVRALEAQVGVEKEVGDIAAKNKSNARQETGIKVDADADKVYREQSQSQQKEAEIQDHIWEEHYKEAVENLQSAERSKIAATQEGSAARLAAIDASLKEENARGLQETGFYRDMLTTRMNLVRQMAEEQARVQEEAGKESASHTLAMAKLQESAQEDADKRLLAVHHASLQAMADADVSAVQRRTQIEVDGYNKEIEALDKFAKDYQVKYQALKDKITETERSADNQIVQIQGQAAVKQTQEIQQAYTRAGDMMASTLAKMTQGHKTFAEAARQSMGQVVQAMAENLIKEAIMQDREKLGAAKTAAAKAFAWAPNPIIGAPLAAAAFAAVMAFEKGGIVPGVDNFDSVPARLTPGEAVLPKNLTEHLTNMAKFGNGGSGAQEIHVHNHYSPTVHAMDGESVHRVLTEHADTFHSHFEDHVRRMNR